VRQPLPTCFAELAHYEWAELAVDVMDCPIPAHHPAGDLMHSSIILNPALLTLSYAWQVHRIGHAGRRRPICWSIAIPMMRSGSSNSTP